MKTIKNIILIGVLGFFTQSLIAQQHPSDVTVCQGSSAQFSIDYSPVITYRWQVYLHGTWSNMNNGGIISGATSSTLTLSSCSAGLNGSIYRCRVSNFMSTSYTNPAVLYVNGISSNPSDHSDCNGSSATFSIQTVGMISKPTYQWQYSLNGSSGWTNISSSSPYASYSNYTSKSLGVSNATRTLHFRCRASSGTCTVYSNTAAYYVTASPVITTQPVSGDVCEDSGSITFTVNSSDPTANYQWEEMFYGSLNGNVVDGTAGAGEPTISGATTRSLTFSNVQYDLHYQRKYRCKVSNCKGTVYSNEVEYTMLAAPGFYQQTGSATICAGGNHNFRAWSTGAGKVYRWQVSTNGGSTWTNLSNGGTNPQYVGVTDSYLYINNAPASISGYQYRNTVTGTCPPTDESDPVTLTVIPSKASVSSQPADDVICIGQSTSFSINAADLGQTYAWYVKNSGAGSYSQISSPGSNPTYAGYTGKTLTVSGAPVTSNQALYKCVLTNVCGSSESSPAILGVNTPTSITTQVTAAEACEQESAGFTFEVSGTTNGQKWQISTNNGGTWSDISSANPPLPDHTGYATSNLTLTNTDFAHDGYFYRSVVTGSPECANSTQTSNQVRLTIKELTAIDHQPVDATVCEGANTTFTVDARGYNLGYQWETSSDGVDWTPITIEGTNPGYSGWDTETLALEGVIANNDSRQFRCKITNECSPMIATSPAVLYVGTPPGSADPVSGPDQACTGEAQVDYSVNTIAGADTYTWTLPNGVVGSSTSNSIKVDFTALAESGFITVKGSNSCGESNPSSKQITIKSPSEPATKAAASETTICPGSSVDLSLSGGHLGDGAEWVWYSGNCGGTQVGTGASIPVSNLTQSTRFFVRAEGDCNSTSCMDTLVEVYAATRILQQPEETAVCFGEEAIISITAEGPPSLSYQWYKGTDPVTEESSNSDLVIPEVTFSDLGKYRCVIRSVCDPEGIQSEAADLNVVPVPTLNLGETRNFCPGTPITLNAGAGFESYLWSTGAISRTIEVDEQGLYSVTITNSDGCSNSDDVYVIADAELPPVDLGPDQTVCQGTTVLLDATNEYDIFSWSDESTAQNLTVTSTGTYFVEVGRFSTTCKTSDTVHVTVAEPFGDQELCIVTVSNTGKNMLIWEKADLASIVGYKVYKGSTSAGAFDSIDYVTNDELSAYIDALSSPETSSDKYRISVVDTCGNESAWSAFHKTIHLAVSPAVPTGFNLSWDHIEVEGLQKSESFPSYYIYRGTSYENLELIDQISSELNQYTDADPPEGEVYYQISAKKLDACLPSFKKYLGEEEYSQSFSNVEDVFKETGLGNENGKDTESMHIYPNPFDHQTLIEFSNPTNAPHLLRITDLTGKLVRETGMVTGDEYVLEQKELQPGVYILELVGEKLIRGQIVIK